MHRYAFMHAFRLGKLDAAMQASVLIAQQIKQETGKRKIYFEGLHGARHEGQRRRQVAVVVPRIGAALHRRHIRSLHGGDVGEELADGLGRVPRRDP